MALCDEFRTDFLPYLSRVSRVQPKTLANLNSGPRGIGRFPQSRRLPEWLILNFQIGFGSYHFLMFSMFSKAQNWG
jgi:hypothetical protein